MNPLNRLLFATTKSGDVKAVENLLNHIKEYNDGLTEINDKLKETYSNASIRNLAQWELAHINLPNEKGFSALHLAVLYKQKDIIQLLLKHRADVNQPYAPPNNLSLCLRNSTPLIFAFERGRNIQGKFFSKEHSTDGEINEILEILLKNGADVAKGYDSNRNTPLFLAARLRLSLCIKTLIEYGANRHAGRFADIADEKPADFTSDISCLTALDEPSLWNIHYYLYSKTSIKNYLDLPKDLLDRIADFAKLIVKLRANPICQVLKDHIDAANSNKEFQPKYFGSWGHTGYLDALKNIYTWTDEAAIKRCVDQYYNYLQTQFPDASTTATPFGFGNKVIITQLWLKITALQTNAPTVKSDVKAETKEEKHSTPKTTVLTSVNKAYTPSRAFLINPLNDLLFDVTKGGDFSESAEFIIGQFQFYNERLKKLDHGLQLILSGFIDKKITFPPSYPLADIDAFCIDEEHAGYNALHLAARNRGVKLVTSLLKNRAKVNLLDQREQSHHTALELALGADTSHNKVADTIILPVVQQLLSHGADPDLRAKDYTVGALYLAAYHRHYLCFHALLNYGANFTDVTLNDDKFLHELVGQPSFWHMHNYFLAQGKLTEDLKKCIANFAALIKNLMTDLAQQDTILDFIVQATHSALDPNFIQQLDSLANWQEDCKLVYLQSPPDKHHLEKLAPKSLQRCAQQYYLSIGNIAKSATSNSKKNKNFEDQLAEQLDFAIDNTGMAHGPMTKKPSTSAEAEEQKVAAITYNDDEEKIYPSPISQVVGTSSSSSSSSSSTSASTAVSLDFEDDAVDLVSDQTSSLKFVTAKI